MPSGTDKLELASLGRCYIDSGHLNTIYCVIGDFTKKDLVEYDRCVCPSPSPTQKASLSLTHLSITGRSYAYQMVEPCTSRSITNTDLI